MEEAAFVLSFFLSSASFFLSLSFHRLFCLSTRVSASACLSLSLSLSLTRTLTRCFSLRLLCLPFTLSPQAIANHLAATLAEKDALCTALEAQVARLEREAGESDERAATDRRQVEVRRIRRGLVWFSVVGLGASVGRLISVSVLVPVSFV